MSVFYSSTTVIESLNLTRGMSACLGFSVRVLSCVGTGLAMGLSTVKEALQMHKNKLSKHIKRIDFDGTDLYCPGRRRWKFLEVEVRHWKHQTPPLDTGLNHFHSTSSWQSVAKRFMVVPRIILIALSQPSKSSIFISFSIKIFYPKFISLCGLNLYPSHSLIIRNSR
jgi:hypothetical protein